MTEEHEHAAPHSDHAAHTAPAEPHPIKKNLWQKWMAWSGSFFVISLLLHIFLIGGATLVVVQVIQGRKEKLKFTAPPPSAAGPSEHKVKPSKKTAAAAPAISKRITSTAANASIALPAMEMSSSTGPDVMASVMSGMGASGLGAGAAGGPGMASMPLAGLTAFGFKGKGKGLVGTFYDLKQTSDRKPTGINVGRGKENCSPQFRIIKEFVEKGWDQAVFDKFFKSKDPVVATQICIPLMNAMEAPKAFDLEREVKGSHWIIHYKGTVRAPRSGTFRFLGIGDDVILVRFDKQDVFAGFWPNAGYEEFYSPIEKRANDDGNKDQVGFPKGRWFSVEAGKSYPIEVLISEVPGGSFQAHLMIEERGKTYPPRRHYPKYSTFPLFQTMKGTPIPEYVLPKERPKSEDPMNHRNPPESTEKMPEMAPEPIVFPSI